MTIQRLGGFPSELPQQGSLSPFQYLLLMGSKLHLQSVIVYPLYDLEIRITRNFVVRFVVNLTYDSICRLPVTKLYTRHL
jgi:hypothetical protein